MATTAVIGRVVHHSVILEFDVPSYRTNSIQQRGQDKELNRQIQLTPDRQECLTWDTTSLSAAGRSLNPMSPKTRGPREALSTPTKLGSIL